MKKIIVSMIAMMIAASVMASTNEILVTIDFQVAKNNVEVRKSPGTQKVQMLGSKFYSATYSLTPTNQPMAKGSVGNLGWAYARNLSTSAMVNISFDVGTTTNMQLLANEACIFRLSPDLTVTNIHAATATGTADFEFTIIEK